MKPFHIFLYLVIGFSSCQNSEPPSKETQPHFTITNLKDTIAQLYPTNEYDSIRIAPKPRRIFHQQENLHQDASLQAFVKQLREAVKNRDADFIYNHLDEKVELSFGGAEGLRNFKQLYKIKNPKNAFWSNCDQILKIGGAFCKNSLEEPNSNRYQFVFPYVFNLELEEPEAYFFTGVITGTNVNIRQSPSLEGEVIDQLSYEVVTFQEPIKIDSPWYKISTLDQKIEGYVHSDYLYCPVFYRMFLGKIDGMWKITVFITGD